MQFATHTDLIFKIIGTVLELTHVCPKIIISNMKSIPTSAIYGNTFKNWNKKLNSWSKPTGKTSITVFIAPSNNIQHHKYKRNIRIFVYAG